MKAIDIIPVVVGVAALLLVGCSGKNYITNPQDSQLYNMPVAQVDAIIKPMNNPVNNVFPINTDKKSNVGSIKVNNDMNFIYVTYQMEPGWILDNSYVELTDNIKSLPFNKQGIPAVEEFSNINKFNPGVMAYTIKIPMSMYPVKIGKDIAIAAFSLMHKAVISDESSIQVKPPVVEGWAGMNPGPGSTDWFYITYTVMPNKTGNVALIKPVPVNESAVKARPLSR